MDFLTHASLTFKVAKQLTDKAPTCILLRIAIKNGDFRRWLIQEQVTVTHCCRYLLHPTKTEEHVQSTNTIILYFDVCIEIKTLFRQFWDIPYMKE